MLGSKLLQYLLFKKQLDSTASSSSYGLEHIVCDNELPQWGNLDDRGFGMWGLIQDWEVAPPSKTRIPTLTALCNTAVQLTKTEERDKFPFGYRSVGLHGGQCYGGKIDWNVFVREQYIDAAKAAVPGLDDEGVEHYLNWWFNTNQYCRKNCRCREFDPVDYMLGPLVKESIAIDAYRTRNPGRANSRNEMSRVRECSAPEDVPDGFIQIRSRRRRPRPLPAQPVALPGPGLRRARPMCRLRPITQMSLGGG